MFSCNSGLLRRTPKTMARIASYWSEYKQAMPLIDKFKLERLPDSQILLKF
jgi:hypothetical protein